VVNSSPNAETARITERGPKNTRPNVAIASASQARGSAIKQKPTQIQYKGSDWVCLLAPYLQILLIIHFRFYLR